MKKRLLYLALALFGAPLLWGQSTVVCTTASPGTVIGSCAGSGFSSPVTTDPVSATGVWTFDNAANTPVTLSDGASGTNLTGTTSVCSVGAPGTANSVCLSSSTITGEGATANAFQAMLAFGDSTADSTVTLTGGSTGRMLIDVGGFNYFALAPQAIQLGSGTGVAWANGTTTTGGTMDTALIRSAAGVVKVTDGGLSTGGSFVVTAGFLTAATMTAETRAYVRDTTSSYTWTNAQVVALGAALTGDITVATLPAKTQVLDAMVVITGAAAGPATVTVSCGDAIGGTPFTNLVAVADAKAAANTVYGDDVAERGTSIDTEFWYLPSYTATTLVTCHFISTGANLDQVTGSTGRVILTTRLLP